MILDELEKTEQELYKQIWTNDIINKYDIVKTPTKKGGSNKSLSFVKETSEIKTLTKNFNITDINLFERKFKMAISGSGKELRRILTLKSSALCALLFFYDCENNPIKMEINNKLISFDKSFFEWKNKVFDNPSCMDVVLYSSKENILFFVESKFSEYISYVTKKYPVPYKYYEDDITRNLYELLKDKEYYKSDFIKTFNNDGQPEFTITSDRKHYIGGIKQNISHYRGILNFLNGNYSEDNTYIKDLPLNNETQYYYTEILYNNNLTNYGSTKNNISYFDDYSKQYHQIEEILTADIKDRGIKNFTILPELYTYTKLKNDNPDLNKEIVNFYFSK